MPNSAPDHFVYALPDHLIDPLSVPAQQVIQGLRYEALRQGLRIKSQIAAEQVPGGWQATAVVE